MIREERRWGEGGVGGGGKVIGDGMGQATGFEDEELLELVITNALVRDYKGIYKGIYRKT